MSDIIGYYTPGNGSYYVPLIPVHITDTRTNSGKQNSGNHLTAGLVLPVNASLNTSVPVNAKAINASLFGLSPTANSYITAYSSTSSRVLSSSVSLTKPITGYNEMITLVGGGKFNLFNAAGTTDAIVDLSGYYY